MAMVSQTAFPPAASKAAVVASGSSFPDALAASSSRGISMRRFCSLTQNQLPTQQPTNLIGLMPIRFTLSVAQTRSQTTLKKQSRLLARRQPLDDLQETLALIPHIKSIANSPSSERSLRPPLFPLALTLPMRFPHHHIHTCNPRLSS